MPSASTSRGPRSWPDSVAHRAILCERQVQMPRDTTPAGYGLEDPVLYAIASSLVEAGLSVWFDRIEGYITAYVREFYTSAGLIPGDQVIRAQ